MAKSSLVAMLSGTGGMVLAWMLTRYPIPAACGSVIAATFSSPVSPQVQISTCKMTPVFTLASFPKNP